jgi:HrpA-like RNA helicase
MISPVPNYAKAAVETTMTIHCNEPTGDVLIFLTGQEEVEMACEMLREKSKALKNVDRLWIVPMYGTLPAREQVFYRF